ncbi:unnamed protein product [Penicillium salamii]|nr:unnamed protein product [Penicillium salamii]
MSQTTINNAIEPPMFIVVVGAERAEMKIHSHLLAGASRALGALVNGTMREAHERKTEWIDVNEETFNRFRQFLYDADYNMPTFADQRTPDDRGNETTPKATSTAVNQYEGRNWPSISWMEIPALDQYRWDSNARADYAWFPHESHQYRDWNDFLVQQLQLYMLADMYDVQPLCGLVLLRTSEFLNHLKLQENNIEAIVNFIDLVYKNTMPTSGDRVDAMRQLASQYAALAVPQLRRSKYFLELLGLQEAFAADFWGVGDR